MSDTREIRQTSVNCYHQIKREGLLSKRRFEVYEAIYKKAPCTTNEAMEGSFSGSHGIGSRTTELRDLGVIYEKGVRECRVTGRIVIEWDLTDNLPFGKVKKSRSEKPANFKKSVKYILSLMEQRDIVYMHKVNLEELIHE